MSGHPADGQDLLPLRDADDLHDEDFAAVLADHLPALPRRTARTPRTGR